MPRHGSPPRAFAGTFLALLWLCGCAPQASVRPASAQEFPGVPAGLDIGSTDTVYPGKLDSEDHYISNVEPFSRMYLERPACMLQDATSVQVLVAGSKVESRTEPT